LLRTNPFYSDGREMNPNFFDEYYESMDFKDEYKECIDALAQGSELSFWGGDVIGLYFGKKRICGAGNYSFFEIANPKVEWEEPFYIPASLAKIGLGSLDVLFRHRKQSRVLAHSVGEDLECIFKAEGNRDIVKDLEKVKAAAKKCKVYRVSLKKSERFWTRLKMLADGNVTVVVNKNRLEIVGATFKEIVGEVQGDLEIRFEISFDIFKQWAEFCTKGFLISVSEKTDGVYLYAETVHDAKMWIGVRHDFGVKGS